MKCLSNLIIYLKKKENPFKFVFVVNFNSQIEILSYWLDQTKMKHEEWINFSLEMI